MIKRAAPVSTKSEQALYKHLVTQASSTEHLASIWNDFVLDALMKQQEVIVILNEEKNEIHLKVADLYLKDARHFEIFHSEKKKSKEIFLHFPTADDFASFQAAQIKPKTTTSSLSPLIPEPLPHSGSGEVQQENDGEWGEQNEKQHSYSISL